MDTRDTKEKSIFSEYAKLVETESLLPIKVSSFYDKKIKEEIKTIGIGGPLYRSAYPVEERLKIMSDNEPRDFVDEYSHMPVEGVNYIIRKYKDRVLFIVTDICFGHCQYCFRTYNIAEFKKCENSISKRIGVLLNYLRKTSEIKEVIFSGGDPLVVGYDNLKYMLDALSKWVIRIHTRAIVYEPNIFTMELARLLSLHNTRLVFHINHPYEICKIVEKKIEMLYNNNVQMYAQFPLLRGVNDNAQLLIKLLNKFDELRIRPLSIFIVDPIKYSSPFRISFKRIEKIFNETNWTTASWVNSTRLVMDTAIGKVRREDIIKIKDNKIIFRREGKEIEYIDFPEELDSATDIKKLLWKEYKQ